MYYRVSLLQFLKVFLLILISNQFNLNKVYIILRINFLSKYLR